MNKHVVLLMSQISCCPVPGF